MHSESKLAVGKYVFRTTALNPCMEVRPIVWRAST